MFQIQTNVCCYAVCIQTQAENKQTNKHKKQKPHKTQTVHQRVTYLILKVMVKPNWQRSGFLRQGKVSSPRLRVP